MKAEVERQTFTLAICLAAMMHLWLFTAFRPASGSGLAGSLVPPATHYLAPSSDSASAAGIDVRTVWSPVFFSLPSEMGFSRDMLQEKLHTRLTFKQPAETQSFLEIDPVSPSAAMQTAPQKLMLTAGRTMAPRPPALDFSFSEDFPAPRRVYMDPGLKARLLGGIVLPPELNKAGESAWEIRADITVSEEGAVRHVFLEQPLEMAALNQSIVRMLHGLRFKPGDRPMEGRVEVYSPESDPGEDEVK